MIRHINWYDIGAFEWHPEQNCFICHNPIQNIHPLTRRQFYILNNDSRGFRRFRFYKTTEIDGVVYNQFKSEDSILCTIKDIL